MDIDLRGVVIFVVLLQLAWALEGVTPAARDVHLHLEHLDHIDHACLELLKEWERQREALGDTVTLEWSELELWAQAPQPRASTRAA